jgi:hypothetical protein
VFVNQQIRIRFRVAADAGDQRDGFYVDDIRLYGYRTSNPTDVGGEVLPKFFALHQNYPNPFNPESNISFDVPTSSFVTLKIFTLLGKEVATLVRERVEAGSYSYTVSADRLGLSSGVYLYQLKANEFIATRKLVLVK